MVAVETANFAELERQGRFEDAASKFEPVDWKILELPIWALNQCSQIRNGANPIQSDLEKSIEVEGQDSAILVGFVDGFLLRNYVEFTNKVYKSKVQIEDFTPLPGYDDYFALVIFGHSRKLAIRNNALRAGQDPEQATVIARVRDITDIGTILAKQRAENIHGGVDTDRTARSYAEEFLWLRQERGITKKEYSQKNGVSANFMNDVLRYVDLPERIRAMTDDGGLPFRLGIELGRALPHVMAEAERTYPFVDPEVPDIETITKRREWVYWDLAESISVFHRKRSIRSFNAHIRNKVEGYKAKQPQPEAKGGGRQSPRPKVVKGFAMQLFDMSPTAELEMRRGNIKDALAEVNGAVIRKHVALQESLGSYARDFMHLPEEELQKIDTDFIAAVQGTVRPIVEPAEVPLALAL